MRINPIKPEILNPDLRVVHDGIAALVGGSQRQVTMTDKDGALIGPFPPMLHYPQFGVPALTFIRSLDNHAKLDKKVREVAILTVGASLGARFALYAHEIMAAAFGLSSACIAHWSEVVLFPTPPITTPFRFLEKMKLPSCTSLSAAIAFSRRS
jgi:4-carboxymuconolactone decarboxylase